VSAITNDLTSEILKKNIYDFLSHEQLNKSLTVSIDKNIVFIPAMAQENIDLYYILEGNVGVYSQSYNGRRFLIDPLGPGQFVGKFSQMRKQNFYCEIKTTTPAILLKLTDIKNELFNHAPFLLYFYIKTSNRVYEMYKISMARTLFSYEELLAYYLLNKANEAGFIGDTDANICMVANISERQYYYITKKFENDHLISNDKKGIYISDIVGLKAIAANVTKFMMNQI